MHLRLPVLVVFVVLLAGLSPATPSLGATVDDDDEVLLRPHDGPNGRYAVITNGELAIEVDAPGMNAASRLTAQDVFDIVNDADGDREVWITDSASEIEYRAGSDLIEGESNGVRVPAGAALEIGIAVDAGGRAAGQDFTETFKVNVGSVDGTSSASGGGGGGLVAPSDPALVTRVGFLHDPARGGYRITYTDRASVRFGGEDGPQAVIASRDSPRPSGPDDPLVTTVGEPLRLTAAGSTLRQIESPDDVIRAAEIEPVGREGSAARVQWTVQRNALGGVDPGRLRIAHRTGDDWDLLETSVRREDDSTFVVEAESPETGGSAVIRSARSEFRWQLDDGRVLRGENIEVAFAEPGHYTVDLTVVDADGRRDTTRATFVVNDRPTVQIEGPTTAAAGEPATFRAVVDDEVGARTVEWRLPGGDTVTGETLTRSFPSGPTELEVVVTDEYGATGRDSHSVLVGRGSTIAVGDIDAATGIAVITHPNTSWIWLILLLLVLLVARRVRNRTSR